MQDLGSYFFMMLEFNICHALSWVLKVGPILAQKTVGMQEELLTKDVILTHILILNVGMRLIKFLKVSKLITFWNVALFVFVLILELKHVGAKLNLNELEIPSKYLCSLPVVIIVPQVNYEVDNSLLSLLSLFVFFDEKHYKMLVECTVICVYWAI